METYDLWLDKTEKKNMSADMPDDREINRCGIWELPQGISGYSHEAKMRADSSQAATDQKNKDHRAKRWWKRKFIWGKEQNAYA